MDDLEKYRAREERIEDKLAAALHAHAGGRHRDAARGLMDAWKLMAGMARDYGDTPKWARPLFEDPEE